MIFSSPLAALGFLTAAGLVAVYCFRRKSPRRPVGSLLLWPKPQASSVSARRRDRLHLPVSFWLELLALVALVTAALSPLSWRRSSGVMHVIMDRSPSMSVHGASARADAFLARERAAGRKDDIRVREVADARELAREYAALSSVLPPGDELLVLTDAPPDFELPAHGVRWEAFGKADVNTAIVSVRRRRVAPGRDSIFTAIRRFGNGPSAVRLTIEGLGSADVELDAQGRGRYSATIDASLPDLKATIPGDAFTADDSAVLARPDVPSLAVALDLHNDALRSAIVRALDATGFVGRFVKVGESPDITVSDRRFAPNADTGFLLSFARASKELTAAPVWCDQSHPLMDGVDLSLEPTAPGETWLPGTPIAIAGERTLISASDRSCFVAFDNPALPFFRSPAFPALVQNTLSIAHSLKTNNSAKPNNFSSSSLLDESESDLTKLATVSLGSHAAIPDRAVLERSMAWMPALVGLLALLLHLALFRRRAMIAPAVLALLAIARPVLPIGDDAGLVVAVVDRSASLDEAARKEQSKLLKALSESRPSDAKLAVVAFGADSAIEQLPSAAPFAGFEQEVREDGSDLTAALARADALADTSDDARVVVVSDGLVALDERLRLKHGVDTYLQSRESKADLAISRLDAPSPVAKRSVVPITAWVETDVASTNSYILYSSTNVVASGRAVFKPGLTPLAFRDTVKNAGLVRYTLLITPSEGDMRPENNRATAVVKVEGSRPLLWLADKTPSSAAASARASGLDVREFRADTFPQSLAALQDYAGVILENVPAKRFGTTFQRELASYVEDFGRGLAMTGGETSFGPGGWYKSPVEDILPVSLELRNDHRKYTTAIAIVMDRSGSMAAQLSNGKTKMDMANLGAAGAIDMLTAADEVSVIAVDSKPHLILALTDGESAKAQTEKVRRIESMGGGIFVEEGLMAALRELDKSKSPNKHIMLFADAADAEEPGNYRSYLSKAFDAGITVSVIALGSERDCDAALLKDIASVGGGECFFESNANEIPRLFMQDTYLSLKEAMVKEPAPIAVTSAMRGLSDSFRPSERTVGGYDRVYMREGAECAIHTTDAEDAPILAFHRAGLGRTLAFTGELSGEYASPLMTSESGGELLAAIARWTLGDDGVDRGGFFFEQKFVPGGVKISAIADEENPDAAVSRSGLQLLLVRESPSLGIVRETTTLEWEDSDALSSVIPLSGDETLYAVAILGDGSPCVLPPICLPYSAEHRRMRDPLVGKRTLARLAERTGGRVLEAADDLWSDFTGSTRRIYLDTPLYLLAATLLLLIVVALRLGMRLSLPVKRTDNSRATAPIKQSGSFPSPFATPDKQSNNSNYSNDSHLSDVLARAKRRASR